MGNQKPTPKIRPVAPVHPRLHLCRGGMLLEIQDGLGKLRCCHGEDRSANYYELYVGEKRMLDGCVEKCPTLGGCLRAGYGESVMNDETCRRAADRVNLPYAGMRDAIVRLKPLLKLLSSGLWLVGDFELFPVDPVGGHALEGQYLYGDELHEYYGPLWFTPAQRADRLDPERIRHYQQVLLEHTACSAPRAVALYLGGCLTLLLDGHHKVAAAASLGRRVPTLVLFPVERTPELEQSLRAGETLEMALSAWDRREDKASSSWWWFHPMELLDSSFRMVSRVRGIEVLPRTEDLQQRDKILEPVDGGRVPAEFCTRLGEYPKHWKVYPAVTIPPDRIKYCMKQVDRSRNSRDWQKYVRELAAFAALFPESRLLSAKDRLRMEEAAKNMNR